MSTRQPSTVAWSVVHILFPLFPFTLEGAIRLFIINGISLDTFSAGTLSLSLGLVAIFVSQSLKNHDGIPSDEKEKDSVKSAALFLLMLSITFFAIFGLLVSFRTLVIKKDINNISGIYKTFQIITFVLSVVPITVSLVAQRSFKLRASISLW